MKKTILSLLVAAAVWTPGVIWSQQGPNRESSETVARPKKQDKAEPEQERIPTKFEKKETATVGPTFRSEATTVNVDVSVLDKNGHPIPNIPRGNFRVLEDGVPQTISKFEQGNEAPMTVAMVIEFSNLYQQYWTETWYQTLTAAYGFLETLKPEDYVAVVAYDMKPEILSDFSTNKKDAYDAMSRLRIPGFSETNLFDALSDTVTRMSDIEGRKAVVLIASGRDTFSRITFDEARKQIQRAGVPVYSIGLMQALREWYDARGAMGPIARMDFFQADNQLRTFSKETGGMAFFPRFYGEFPTIFRNIAEALRTSYTLSYTPSNTARDGKFRKIKVELVNPATGEQLRVVDEKGKPMKYTIMAKNGYTAPREVE